jgi:hypothetical protein
MTVKSPVRVRQRRVCLFWKKQPQVVDEPGVNPGAGFANGGEKAMMDKHLKPVLWATLLMMLTSLPLQAQEASNKDSGILHGTIEQVGDGSIVINQKTYGFTQNATIRLGEKEHVFSKNLLSSQWVGKQVIYRYREQEGKPLLMHLFIPTHKAQISGG